MDEDRRSTEKERQPGPLEIVDLPDEAIEPFLDLPHGHPSGTIVGPSAGAYQGPLQPGFLKELLAAGLKQKAPVSHGRR